MRSNLPGPIPIVKEDSTYLGPHAQSLIVIMEYGSTPYVGLTRKKHGRHTLAQILFSIQFNSIQ